jgi:3D (Asp-Asp-Asp) domain-containing protein
MDGKKKNGKIKKNKGANGKYPIPNLTVAAPRSIPMGTKLQVSYNGIIDNRIVGDRGRDIIEGKMDFFVKSCRDAYNFGIKEMHIMIVK